MTQHRTYNLRMLSQAISAVGHALVDTMAYHSLRARWREAGEPLEPCAGHDLTALLNGMVREAFLSVRGIPIGGTRSQRCRAIVARPLADGEHKSRS